MAQIFTDNYGKLSFFTSIKKEAIIADSLSVIIML